MKPTLTIGLCLYLLTFGPRGGHGGGPAIVKPNNCLNTNSNELSHDNVRCTSSSSSGKHDMTPVENEAYEEPMESMAKPEQTKRSLVPSHKFMRFGRDHKFFRFGRAIQHDIRDDETEDGLEFESGDLIGGNDQSKRSRVPSHKFMRFGRGRGETDDAEQEHSFFRFGRGRDETDDMDQEHPSFRFGRLPNSYYSEPTQSIYENQQLPTLRPGDDQPLYYVPRVPYVQPQYAGKGADEPSRESRLYDRDLEAQVSQPSFLRIGRNPNAPSHKFMRFGRIPEHMFFRFGRSGSSLSSPATKNPFAFTTPIVKTILSSTADNDLPLKSSLIAKHEDDHSMGDHSNSNVADSGMKMKREGHMFMRFGRK